MSHVPPFPARHLWLLRHGKAVSDEVARRDRDRPLTERGRRDATALGTRLASGSGSFGLEDIPVPERVLCSAAARTSQTADLVVGGMGGGPAIESYWSLYGAETDVVLEHVREIDDAVISAMIVGHNPTIYRLAWELTGGADDRSALHDHGFSTCTVAVLRFGVESWRHVLGGDGVLTGVFSPPF